MNGTALLIIDMMNTFDFPEGDKLLRHAEVCSKNIFKLKKRCFLKKIPVIYINDNFTKWKSDWDAVWKICSSHKSRGREISHLLRPQLDDYIVLKPKHSAFYSTVLDVLLKELKIKKIIMTGVAGNICIMFSANDAYMRGYEVIIPKDCIASNYKADNDYALKQFKEVFKFKILKSSSLRLV